MNADIFELLEQKIDLLLERHQALQRENLSLREEIRKLASEREGIKDRIDAILMKLEEI
jgi:cell division protein ZapB